MRIDFVLTEIWLKIGSTYHKFSLSLPPSPWPPIPWLPLSPSWIESVYIAQGDLEFTRKPAWPVAHKSQVSTSQMMGLQALPRTPSFTLDVST